MARYRESRSTKKRKGKKNASETERKNSNKHDRSGITTTNNGTYKNDIKKDGGMICLPSKDSQVLEPEENCCHWCGKYNQTIEVCDCCLSVSYCSKECQLHDWRAGMHRKLCVAPKSKDNKSHYRQLHDALVDLNIMEIAWLQSLSIRYKTRLLEDHTKIPAKFENGKRKKEFKTYVKEFPITELNEWSLIAMIVTGALNCYYDTLGRCTNRRFVSDVLQPWYQKHQAILKSDSVGFSFLYVDWIVLSNPNVLWKVLSRNRNPSNNRATQITDGTEDIGGGILYLNRRILSATQLKQIESFFSRDTVTKTSKMISSYQDFNKLTTLGSLLLGKPRDKECEEFCFNKSVYLNFSVFGNGVRRNPFFPIGVHEDNAVAAGELFWNCYNLMQQVGFDMTFSVGKSGRGDWSHRSMVESYLAAAGNDIDLFMKWMNEGHGFDHFDETFNEDSFLIAKMFESQKKRDGSMN